MTANNLFILIGKTCLAIFIISLMVKAGTPTWHIIVGFILAILNIWWVTYSVKKNHEKEKKKKENWK